jgi:arabinofuranosyltransferase
VLLIAPALLGLLPWPSLSDVRASRGRALRALLPAIRAALLGFSPLLLWLAFCVVYYGFAFPNTAYAKLNTHLPAVELIKQGFVYLGDSVQRDPLTPAVIALGLFGAWRQRGLAARTLAAGVVLYLMYLLRIGGDFMAGRFLTAPFLVCVVVLATVVLPRLSLRELAPIALGSAALGLCFSANFERVERFDCKFDESGIANERYCYAAHTGLLVNLRVPKYKSEGRYRHGLAMRREKLKVAPAPNVGLTGIAAGPSVHVLDTLALTEPLLARIPYQAQGSTFRIGHFHRDAPAGYMETLASGHNQIKDACVHKYYDVLSRVIRGPLFSGERWRAIVELNLGVHDYLMEPGCTRPSI